MFLLATLLISGWYSLFLTATAISKLGVGLGLTMGLMPLFGWILMYGVYLHDRKF